MRRLVQIVMLAVAWPRRHPGHKRCSTDTAYKTRGRLKAAPTYYFVFFVSFVAVLRG
jgi:hypothetical protein